MEILVLAVVLVALLALNAFFVLAEFAVVKVRPSRVAQLVAERDQRAALVAGIQERLDEYLSVCQVGITLASVALGMVGERIAATITGDDGGSAIRYGLAITVSYVMVSGSHILLGELVPKSIAIRLADRAALFSAKPLRFFHVLFFPALWVLTALSNGILRMFRLGDGRSGEHHSEEELRIILDQSQERGLMSFRRLIFMENVFDFGDLVVRDAMRQRSQVRTLDARLPWEENLRVIRGSHFSRYPLIAEDPERPVGFVHVKDLVIHGECVAPDLRALARSLLATTEATPLEAAFAEMQRRRIQVALVADGRGRWTGLVTFEDIVEELVGTIRDEFEDEEPVRLSDALTAERVLFGVEAGSPIAAVRAALARLHPRSLPMRPEKMLGAVEGRGRLVGNRLGSGVSLTSARVAGLDKPFAMVLRSAAGILCEGSQEKATALIVLLTPAGQPRIHQRLQSIVAELVHESDYVRDRLLTADSAEEIVEVLRTGEQAALD